jgi:hypothetical protein
MTLQASGNINRQGNREFPWRSIEARIGGGQDEKWEYETRTGSTELLMPF